MSQDILLSNQEINDRLHYFNLTQDYSVFTGIPVIQEVSFMYPSFTRVIGQTDDQYKKCLSEHFGPLSPKWREKYNDWLKDKLTIL